MEFINETDAQARLFRTCLDETGEVMTALLVARATFVVGARGLVPDRENALPIFPEPLPTDFGELPADHVLGKRGCDLIALGNAYPAGGRRAASATVRLQVGDFTRSLLVFGDRVWTRRGGHLVASEARPFERMPLVWEHVYGGKARRGTAAIAHDDNVVGKGFYLEEDQAAGGPLPNIEDPEARIEQWTDHPRPINLAPVSPTSRFAAENFLDIAADGEVQYRGAAFNCAHPKLRVPALRGGEGVRLSGMTPGDPLAFVLPRGELAVAVALEDRRYEFQTTLDTLYIFPEERRVAITYRCHFTYRYVREEKRVTRLLRAARTSAP